MQGDDRTKWRLDKFKMFEGGSWWQPPPHALFELGMPPQLYNTAYVPKRRRSNDKKQANNIAIGDAMVWCLDHAECSKEITQCIFESLCIKETPLHRKIARIYLVSDILANCAVRVKDAFYYRQHFGDYLLKIFSELNEALDSIESRLKAEQFRQRVMLCFRNWEDHAVYPTQDLIKWQNVFLGLLKCALASDTGGSARYPAVLNGVYGFKPSYGHLSRHGLVPLANALDTPSIMTKSISDCKRYFELLKGQDPMDITTLPDNLHSQKVQPMPKNLKELTIGIPKYERTDLLSKDAEEIYQKIINLLISNGVVIKQVLLPNLEYAVNCYSVVVDVEIASNMARFDGIRYGYCINKEQLINDDSFIAYIKRNRSESLGTGVKRRIFAGNYYSLNDGLGGEGINNKSALSPL
uniref:CID domain-containing protein n=1 Tax=Meloidogyne javanica TaxID=6303 RepID=A0A915N344_MELJA